MDKLLLPYARSRSRSTILSQPSSITNKPSNASSGTLEDSVPQIRASDRSIHSLILTGASGRRAMSSGSRYVSIPGHSPKTPAHGAKKAGLLKRFMGVPKDIADESATDASQAHLSAVDEPVGCVAFYIKHCKDFSNTLVLKKRMQLTIRVSVGNIMKSTTPHHIRELLKMKKSKILIPFEEVKYFCVQVPRGMNDDRNKISIELLGLERLSESQRLLGRTYLHLFDIVRQVSVTDTYELGIKNLRVCNLDMSIDFAYGYFGYGFSNQLKQPENEKQKIQEKSLFLRIPPQENRKDQVHNVITYQPMPYPAFLPDDLQVTVGRDREREAVLTETSDELKKVPRKVLQLMKSRKRLDQLRFEYNERKTEEQRIEFLEQLILRKVGKSRKMLRSERKMKGAVWAGPGERSTSPKAQPEPTSSSGITHPEIEIIETGSSDISKRTSESQDLIGQLVDMPSMKGTTDQRLAASPRSTTRRSSVSPLKSDIIQEESNGAPDYSPINIASVVTIYKPFIKFLKLIHRFSNRMLGVTEAPQEVDDTANLESVPGMPDGSAKSQEQDLETTVAAPSPESDLPSPETTKPESEEQGMLAVKKLDGESDLEKKPSMLPSPEATSPDSEQDKLEQNRKAEELYIEKISQSMPSIYATAYSSEISADLLSILRNEDGMFRGSTEVEELTTSFLTSSLPVSTPQPIKVESPEIGSQLPKTTSQEDVLPGRMDSLEIEMSSLTTSLIDLKYSAGPDSGLDLERRPQAGVTGEEGLRAATIPVYVVDTKIPETWNRPLETQSAMVPDVKAEKSVQHRFLYSQELSTTTPLKSANPESEDELDENVEPSTSFFTSQHRFLNSQELSTTTLLKAAKPESEDELDENLEPSTSFFTSQKQAGSDHKPVYATTTASVTTLFSSESDSDMDELDMKAFLGYQSRVSRQKGRYSIASTASLISLDSDTEAEESSEFLPATQGEKEKQVDVSLLQAGPALIDSELAAERELSMSLTSYQKYAGSHQSSYSKPSLSIASFLSLSSDSGKDIPAENHIDASESQKLLTAADPKLESKTEEDEIYSSSKSDALSGEATEISIPFVAELVLPESSISVDTSEESEQLEEKYSARRPSIDLSKYGPKLTASVSPETDTEQVETTEISTDSIVPQKYSARRPSIDLSKYGPKLTASVSPETDTEQVETTEISTDSTVPQKYSARRPSIDLSKYGPKLTASVSPETDTEQDETTEISTDSTVPQKYSARRPSIDLSKYGPKLTASVSPETDTEQDETTEISTDSTVPQKYSARRPSIDLSKYGPKLTASVSPETDTEQDETTEISTDSTVPQKYSARRPSIDLSKYGPKLTASVSPETDTEQDETTEISTDSTVPQKYTARRPSMDLSKYGPNLTALVSSETDTEQDKTTEISTESTVPQKYQARRRSMDLSKYGPKLTAFGSPGTDREQDKTTKISTESTVPQKYSARRLSMDLSKYGTKLTVSVSPETDTEQDETTEISTESTVPQKYPARRRSMDLSKHGPTLTAFVSPETATDQDKTTEISTESTVPQKYSARRLSMDLSKYGTKLTVSVSPETDTEQDETTEISTDSTVPQKYPARRRSMDLSKHGPTLTAFVSPETATDQDKTTEISTESTVPQKYQARRRSMDLSKYGPKLTAFVSPETDREQDKTTKITTESTVLQKYSARRLSMDLSKYGTKLTVSVSPETDTEQDETTEISTDSTVPQKYTARRRSMDLSKYGPNLTAFVSPEIDTEQDKTTEISTESTVPQKYTARRPSIDLSKYGPHLTAFVSPETATEQDKTTEISTESTVPQKYTARRQSMDLSKDGPTLTEFVSPETATEQDETTEISTESTVPQAHSEKSSRMDSAKRRLLAAESDRVPASHKKTSAQRKSSMRRHSLQWSNTGPAIDLNAVHETEIEQDKSKLATYKKGSRKRFSLDLSKYRPSLTSITSVESERERAEAAENSALTAHDITEEHPEAKAAADEVKHEKHSRKRFSLDLSRYRPSLTSIASVDSEKDSAEVAENSTLTARDIIEEHPEAKAAADEVKHEDSGQQEQKQSQKRFSLDSSKNRSSLTSIARVENEREDTEEAENSTLTARDITEEHSEAKAAADEVKHEKGSQKRFSLDSSKNRPSLTSIANVESEKDPAEVAENSTLTAHDIIEEHSEAKAAADEVKHEKGSQKRFSLDLSKYRPSLTSIARVENEREDTEEAENSTLTARDITEEHPEAKAAADEVKHEKGSQKRFSLDLSKYRPSLTSIARVENEREDTEEAENSTLTARDITEEHPEAKAAADEVKHEKGSQKRFSLDLSKYRPSLTSIARVENEREDTEEAENSTLTARDITEEHPEAKAAADEVKHEDSGQQEQKGSQKRFSLDLSKYRPSLTSIARVENEREDTEEAENSTLTARDITEQHPEAKAAADEVKHEDSGQQEQKGSQKRFSLDLSKYRPSLTSIARVENEREDTEEAENSTLTARDITEEHPEAKAAADEVKHEDSGQQEQKGSQKRFSLDLSKYRPSLTSIARVENEREDTEEAENSTLTARDITEEHPEAKAAADEVKHEDSGQQEQKGSQKRFSLDLSKYRPSLTSIARVENEREDTEEAENSTLTARDITEEHPEAKAAADEVKHEKGSRKRFSLDLSKYRPSLTSIARVENEREDTEEAENSTLTARDITEEHPEAKAAADEVKHEKGSQKRFSLDLSKYRPSLTSIARVENEREDTEEAENSTLTSRDITEEHPEAKAAADEVKHEKGSQKRFSLDLSKYRPSLTSIASVESEREDTEEAENSTLTARDITEEHPEAKAAADEVKHEKGSQKRFSLDLSKYRPSLTSIANVESEKDSAEVAENSTLTARDITEEHSEAKAAADDVKHEKGSRKRFSLDLSKYRPSLTSIARVENEREDTEEAENSTLTARDITEEHPEAKAAADEVKHEDSGQQEQMRDKTLPKAASDPQPSEAQESRNGSDPTSDQTVSKIQNVADQQEDVFDAMISFAMKELDMEASDEEEQKRLSTTSDRCRKTILFPEVVVTDRKQGSLGFKMHRYVLEQDKAGVTKHPKVKAGSTKGKSQKWKTCRYVRKPSLERLDSEHILNVLRPGNAVSVQDASSETLPSTTLRKQDMQQNDGVEVAVAQDKPSQQPSKKRTPKDGPI
ncbi:uncharacterized protein [Scyliorhinus torazame]|uniref:uncharacterized protein isoform X4 n=1 Tax=Scyliorhinus torazame TaxID=75743 RepID=UPI003B5B075A